MGIDPIDNRPMERIPPVNPVTNAGDKAEEKPTPETNERKKEAADSDSTLVQTYVYDARGRVWGIIPNPHPDKGTKH